MKGDDHGHGRIVRRYGHEWKELVPLDKCVECVMTQEFYERVIKARRRNTPGDSTEH